MQFLDPQLQILRLYRTLNDHRADWSGTFVFSCGPEAPRSGAAPAAATAGAVSLLLAEDGHEVKKALRRGDVDRIVESMDDAVAALRYNVRKKNPLSIALVADVDAALAEMIERGVQPDVWLGSDESPAAAQPLFDNGMARLDVARSAGQLATQPMVLHGETLREYFIATRTPTQLRDADARVLRLLPKDETLRRRWIERASQYVRSAGDGRWSYLSEGEAFLLESEGLKLRELATLPSPLESQPTEL